MTSPPKLLDGFLKNNHRNVPWVILYRQLNPYHSAEQLLGYTVENLLSKAQWNSLVHKHVNSYWVERIKSRALLYTSLEYLAADNYYTGIRPLILQHSGIARDVPGVHEILRLVTGTYILRH